MKNKNINLAIKILITSLLVFMFISCNEGITTADENVSTNKNANFLKLGNYDLQNVNKSIDTFSKILASTLNDIGMRKIIFDSVGKKFDGDYDILFMNLKNNQIFWDKLSAKANDAGLTNADFNVIISQIPKLQISLPVNYNIWDVTSFVPKVAFRPYDKDDRDIDSVKAYDQAGTLYLLDAKTKPSEPVLVVGINERTNYDGIIIYASSCDGCGGSGGSGGPSSSGTLVYKQKVFVNDFRLMNTSEGWFDGDPEIYIKTLYQGKTTRTDFPHVNNIGWYNENNYSWLPKAIYSTTSYIDLNDVVYVDVWEEDVIWDDHLEGHWSVIDRPFDGDITDNIEGYKNDWSWGYDRRTLYDGGSANSDLIMYGKTVLE